MRFEEILLMAAEATAHLNNVPEAAQYVNELRASCGLPNLSQTINLNDLLLEIKNQRRIELWGEGFRRFDILHYKEGYQRDYAGTNHPILLSEFDIADPESWNLIYPIPFCEFEHNAAIT